MKRAHVHCPGYFREIRVRDEVVRYESYGLLYALVIVARIPGHANDFSEIPKTRTNLQSDSCEFPLFLFLFLFLNLFLFLFLLPFCYI
jgi:hypothetical protein